MNRRDDTVVTVRLEPERVAYRDRRLATSRRSESPIGATGMFGTSIRTNGYVERRMRPTTRLSTRRPSARPTRTVRDMPTTWAFVRMSRPTAR